MHGVREINGGQRPPKPTLSSEFRLVTACIRWPPSETRTEAIRKASSKPLDWSRVLRVAKRHQVIGLVHDGLTRARKEVPTDIATAFSTQAGLLVREDLALAAEAARLQRSFDEAGLPLLFVKGTSLALLAYGKLGLRSAKDIDLLVPYEWLGAATALLARSGYYRVDPPTDTSAATMRLLMPLRKDLDYVHESNGRHIELHWRLFLNPLAMDETSIFADSRIVALAGSTGLRTLGDEDLFTYLCVHGARHWWYQLKWLADVGAVLANAKDDLERFYRAAEERSARRPAAQAMLLCQQLLGTPLSATFSEELAKTPRADWLQRTALNAMDVSCGDREPRKSRFGTTRGSLSVLLLGEGWRYRLAELRQLLIVATDVSMVPLPKGLWFLYPILRLPLWVWRNLLPNTR